MKMKKFELIGLHHIGRTLYKAVMYDRLHGYYKEQVFMGYTKKEVYKRLRNEYSCYVSRDFR